MLGKIETGIIVNRDEVVPRNIDGYHYYQGILSIAGRGRWETPLARTTNEAQTLLDDLRKQHMPQAETLDGISAAQAAVFAQAIDGQVRPRSLVPQAEVVRRYAEGVEPQ